MGQLGVVLDPFGPEYYHHIYRHYERQNPPYKHLFYRETIIRLAGNTGRILDVGCAFGKFLASMPETWCRFGIDISSFAIESGQRRYPAIELASATLETNPFTGPFDVVTSFDVIEHIPNLSNVAARINSLLKPGGLFVFAVPVYDGPLGPVVHLLDRDPTHVHKKHRKFWLAWVKRHFDLVEWKGMFRMLIPSGPYVHWPTHPLRSIAPALLVVARQHC